MMLPVPIHNHIHMVVIVHGAPLS